MNNQTVIIKLLPSLDSGIPDSEIMTPFEKQKLFEQYGIGGEHEQKDKGFAVQTGC